MGVPALRVLLVSLCVQATFGQVQLQAEGMRQVDHNIGQGHLGPVGNLAGAFNKVDETAEAGHLPGGYTDLGSSVVPEVERPNAISGPLNHVADRNLQAVIYYIYFRFVILGCTVTTVVTDVTVIVLDANGMFLGELLIGTVSFVDGVAVVHAEVLDLIILNTARTGFCMDCTFELSVTVPGCTSTTIETSDIMVKTEDDPKICITFDLTILECSVSTTTDLVLVILTDQRELLGQLVISTVSFVGGEAMIFVEVYNLLLVNPAGTGFCVDCIIELGTPVLPCTSNAIVISNVVVEVKGDPHMVGLLGQKIDWVGEDNAWYSLLSDGPDFQINVRVSAPMPEEFPDRQLVSAISILSEGGHSLVIEVKNPYSTETDGCPDELPVPCLADGGVRILVDEEVSSTMQTPSEGTRLPGGVIVSTANLQPECRSFGADRIWAEQFAQMMAVHRSLRSSTLRMSFSEWILVGQTLAAPTWCAKLLEEGGSAGLLSGHSNHAIARVEMPAVTVRVNVGVNYQDEDTGPDVTVVVPELKFWQIDLGFERFRYSDKLTGLLGDTSRFVLDEEGLPVTAGLGALHAPVESYRVDGPFGRDFEKMHQ